jgi:hypothetical protein
MSVQNNINNLKNLNYFQTVELLVYYIENAYLSKTQLEYMAKILKVPIDDYNSLSELKLKVSENIVGQTFKSDFLSAGATLSVGPVIYKLGKYIAKTLVAKQLNDSGASWLLGSYADQAAETAEEQLSSNPRHVLFWFKMMYGFFSLLFIMVGLRGLLKIAQKYYNIYQYKKLLGVLKLFKNIKPEDIPEEIDPRQKCLIKGWFKCNKDCKYNYSSLKCVPTDESMFLYETYLKEKRKTPKKSKTPNPLKKSKTPTPKKSKTPTPLKKSKTPTPLKKSKTPTPKKHYY